MQQNILKESDITKIYLSYSMNGTKKQEPVNLRFMDTKECYLSAPLLSSEFIKPKRKTPVEITVFTPEGIYKTQVSLNDCKVLINDIMYIVSIPKTWNFIQVRKSTRKQVKLPVKIAFNDGYELNVISHDLSVGGVSFYTKENISGIYRKVPGILTLELPHETIINFPEGRMVVETRFVRCKEGMGDNFDTIFYVFKFVNTPLDNEEILKHFLIKLD